MGTDDTLPVYSGYGPVGTPSCKNTTSYAPPALVISNPITSGVEFCGRISPLKVNS